MLSETKVLYWMGFASLNMSGILFLPSVNDALEVGTFK